MRAVIQRVSESSVHVDQKIVSSIGNGLLVLLGVTHDDDVQDAEYLVQKISQMRIFSDSDMNMNLSVLDVRGDILVVSQFTLLASTKKGNRPSYIDSARRDKAKPLYEYFLKKLSQKTERSVQAGIFGAMMQVQLINDGPVTIVIDSKNKS